MCGSHTIKATIFYQRKSHTEIAAITEAIYANNKTENCAITFRTIGTLFIYHENKNQYPKAMHKS